METQNIEGEGQKVAYGDLLISVYLHVNVYVLFP